MDLNDKKQLSKSLKRNMLFASSISTSSRSCFTLRKRNYLLLLHIFGTKVAKWLMSSQVFSGLFQHSSSMTSSIISLHNRPLEWADSSNCFAAPVFSSTTLRMVAFSAVEILAPTQSTGLIAPSTQPTSCTSYLSTSLLSPSLLHSSSGRSMKFLWVRWFPHTSGRASTSTPTRPRARANCYHTKTISSWPLWRQAD